MTREEFLKTIPTLKKVYMLFSNYTKAPYVSCHPETFDDEVAIYLNKEEAQNVAQQMTAAKENAFVAEIAQDSMLQMFTNLHLYGINAVEYMTEDDRIMFQLDEIINVPDPASMPEDKRPVQNTSLHLCMLYYMQEVRKKPEKPDIAKLRAMEEEMLVNVTRGNYMVPFTEVENDGEKSNQMALVKIADNSMMIPIFTDPVEFGRFRGDNELKYVALTFDKLATIPFPEEIKGLLINPSGVSVPITKEWIQKLVAKAKEVKPEAKPVEKPEN